MNILIIGNGFDLAHGLPTSYRDFLKFVNLTETEICSRLQSCGLTGEESAEDAKRIKQLIKENYWINYFNNTTNYGERWVDFEGEISKRIQIMDEVRKLVNSAQKRPCSKHEVECFNEIANDYQDIYDEFEFEQNIENLDLLPTIKKKLLEDLNKLIQCLELYICQYINKIDISSKKMEWISNLHIDNVLSFNYTDTYERLYGNTHIQYHYIHGKADISNTIQSCNMVLGIDEYLTGTQKDDDNEYIEFKKFFQRIYKGTGATYKEWVHNIEEMKKIAPKAHYTPDEIYIMGHSLDVTDKDVLYEIVSNSYTKIHIYYHNQKALADQIANLVKVVGQDKLIEYTYTQNPKIEFILQPE